MQEVRANKFVVITQGGMMKGTGNQKDIYQSNIKENKHKGWTKNIYKWGKVKARNDNQDSKITKWRATKDQKLGILSIRCFRNDPFISLTCVL